MGEHLMNIFMGSNGMVRHYWPGFLWWQCNCCKYISLQI